MRRNFNSAANLWFALIAALSVTISLALATTPAHVSATHTGASSNAHWSVSTQPFRIVNGSPILFRVLVPRRLISLSGKWLGHEINFSFDEHTHTWFALAGAGQETKPGEYPLQLNGEISTESSAKSSAARVQFEKQVRIQRQRYPRVLLKVPARYTAPSPEDQQEIAQDKEIKTDAFKTTSPDRSWQGSFVAPVDAAISDVFGVERVFNGSVQSTHQGLDFRVPAGTPVSAVNSGHVILARSLFFEGNCVVIDHGQGLLTLYLHLSKFSVKEGDDVKKGQEIGLSGGTGRATGPHLHLAVRWQGVYLDPQTLLKLKLQ